MRQYPLKIKIIASLVIGLECLILIFILGFFAINRYKGRVLGASVARIDHEKIDFKPSNTLPKYYEWKPNESIEYENVEWRESISRRTNSDGLVEDVERNAEKAAGTFRILALGDSFTEGPYVRYQDTYPIKLEIMINALLYCGGKKITAEVLNLGNWGYDIEFASHRLLTKGYKYKPDLVIWFIKNDDFTDYNELLIEKIDKYMDELTDAEKEDMTRFIKYDQIDENVKLSNSGVREMLHNIASKEIVQEVSQEELFSIQTRAVVGAAKAVQVPIVLMTFKGTESKYKTRMKIWSASEENIHFFDGLENLADDETFKPYDWHPNEKGYQKIAANVYAYLSESRLICHE